MKKSTCNCKNKKILKKILFVVFHKTMKLCNVFPLSSFSSVKHFPLSLDNFQKSTKWSLEQSLEPPSNQAKFLLYLLQNSYICFFFLHVDYNNLSYQHATISTCLTTSSQHASLYIFPYHLYFITHIDLSFYRFALSFVTIKILLPNNVPLLSTIVSPHNNKY